MADTAKPKRGGKRPGSGRKPGPGRKVVSVSLPVALHAEYIKRGGAAWLKATLEANA
jgi:hypothetical protein